MTNVLQILQENGGFGNKMCEDCTQYICHTEHEPYGETTAARTVCECTCSLAKDCPAYENYIQHILDEWLILLEENEAFL